jgi:hypothetical protein
MLAAIIPVIGPILDTILKRTIPDPEARQKAIAELYMGLQTSDLAQMEVNKAEAGSSSIFVAGWRPFIGWVCGMALFYQFLLSPLAIWIGFMIGKPIPKPPTLDEHLWELMFGMLGMGALRSFEKLKGVAR